MAKIERFEKNDRLSRIVVHNGTVYLSGLTADDKNTDTAGQTQQILEKADALLRSVGADRSSLLLAQIWLRDVKDFDEMNKTWVKWLDGAEPPARATVGASFALPEIRVEIQFTAAI
ncbi:MULTISPECIES: RidA family protein [unclassified Mesorhizobium]|uniref:RidA family protein n=1 Tax=unclassified Mesorhizobium TaxID=325217 RepID=UPI001CCD013D|nr:MULTISPECIES: RidA family protein [unclassified Mesorhizobium]MBZ9743563.1 RidA family protein [Mesorhizobium sp. CO1-1-4]MBZ9806224.1 RidA family protein [Mesorhizobium sp. ES1-6]